jgi:hypothetical protein
MDFTLIRNGVKKLTFDALRTDCDNFFEGVLFKEELEKLNTQLQSFLGEPVYPSKARPPLKALEAANGFGGITSGQTLYYKHDGNDAVLAMLWPWKDGMRTTLKIVQQQ